MYISIAKLTLYQRCIITLGGFSLQVQFPASVNIKNSERPKIAKERHRKKKDHHNKVLYKKFEDLVNFQHSHGGRTDMKHKEKKLLSYWVKKPAYILPPVLVG